MADLWVRAAQQWVNDNYSSVSGFVPAPLNGLTGWRTMYALTRALQVELGITSLSDAFGPTTMSRLTTQFPNVTTSTSNAKVKAIVQCALWCKGYTGGANFGTWNADTASGIATMRSNMGLTAAASITPKIFKSLLTMDAYVVVPGGTAVVRSVQQSLNARYLGRSAFSVIPCDGLYSRDVQTGLMYALQYEIGMTDAVANGELGPSTKTGLSSAAANVVQGSTDTTKYFVHLFQAALAFNGYLTSAYNGAFSASMTTSVKAFQAFMMLPQSGRADFQTWAALLISCGDQSRAATGFDCSELITPNRAALLKNNGYGHAIRYLNGLGSKRIGPTELAALWANNMRWAPVYQEHNNAIGEFSTALGSLQGQRMYVRLRQLGVGPTALGFLAVDFDATQQDIEAAVLPHFQAVVAAFAAAKNKPYRLGVYGTRNVCNQLAQAGLTAASFVSDMSWGYSGNLGFRMPTNWAYDQFDNVLAEDNPYGIEIDRNIVSPRAEPLSANQVARTPRTYGGPLVSGYDETFYWRMSAMQYLVESKSAPSVSADFHNELILTFLQQPVFWVPSLTNPDPRAGYGTGIAWAAFLTPEIYNRVSEGTTDQVVTAQGAFLSEMARERDTPGSDEIIYRRPADDGRFGDAGHWAVATRGFTKWGVPAPAGTLAISDLTSWGLDLVTFWNDYETARFAAGGTLDVRTYTADNLGAETGTHFNRSNLRGDMAAFIVAKRIPWGNGILLEDVVRDVLVKIEDDPGWLAKTFVAERFGSRAAIVQLVQSVFTDAWITQFARNWFLWSRPPGEAGETQSPSAAVRATELNALGHGFADALDKAMLWTER